MNVKRLSLCLMAAALVAQPAAAQSILRDAETEAWLDDLVAPLAAAAGLDPANVDVVLIADNSLNAFVMTGQTIYIHSGTILQADNANQIQGILAHELGHIAGGHAVRFGSEGGSTATGISLLSLVAAAGAIAAGAGDAGMALLGLGQRAAVGTVLSFTRQQESRADQAGAAYLNTAGISGRGYIDFFKKLENQEFRYAVPQDEETEYVRTHPNPGNRIQNLTNVLEPTPYWDKPVDPDLEERFERIKAKLYGYVSEPEYTLRTYPASDTRVQAHVARAYAYHKEAYPDKAAEEVDAVLAAEPDDPYALELKGQILLESGRPADAIGPLEEAVTFAPNQPLIASLYGHALLSTDDPGNVGRAVEVLKQSVRDDRENPFAWYQLGIAYSRQGDEARAALASAEQHSLSREPQLAASSAKIAMAGIPEGSPDWIRAQDILMVASNQLDEEGGKRRRR